MSCAQSLKSWGQGSCSRGRRCLKRVGHLLLLGLLTACGGSTEPPPQPSVATGDTPVYDLHEWGVVSVGPLGFEVAAGPGLRPRPDALTVDKPVIYVHSETPFQLKLSLELGNGFRVAEHFPVVSTVPVSWDVSVLPESCRGTYPSSCRTQDGYCETAELSIYETSDAACLRHGTESLPLLFYRLRTDSPPTLPLSFVAGATVTAQNSAQPTSGETFDHFWRVVFDPRTGTTRAGRFPVPAVGGSLAVPQPTGDVRQARAALRADLGSQGLTTHEAEAFMRGWDSVLFGSLGSTDRGTADSPVNIDTLADEIDLPRPVGAPRVNDAILYWLTPAYMDTLATLHAQPAPRNLSRAMLVRVDLQ